MFNGLRSIINVCIYITFICFSSDGTLRDLDDYILEVYNLSFVLDVVFVLFPLMFVCLFPSFFRDWLCDEVRRVCYLGELLQIGL